MDEEFLQKIKERIAQLRRDRQRFVEQVSQQLGAFDGAITELETLLAQMNTKEHPQNG